MSPAQGAPAFSAGDAAMMARALQLAEHGRYTTRPNPLVGCVIARDGVVLGEGWHSRAGEAHAEVNALREAGETAHGATAYVTLEPCAHHGRTPPCADALVRAGITRVVAASQDPFHKVSGQGFAMLRAAGVTVDVGLMEAQARALNRSFFSRVERGRPWLRVKLAMSLDGRTALASGESLWITSEASRIDVQRWRARSGAILTGLGTVLADDPRLTVRLPEDEVADMPPPLRVVLDTRGRMPSAARLVTDGAAPTLAVHADDFVPAYDDHVEAFPVRRVAPTSTCTPWSRSWPSAASTRSRSRPAPRFRARCWPPAWSMNFSSTSPRCCWATPAGRCCRASRRPRWPIGSAWSCLNRARSAPISV